MNDKEIALIKTIRYKENHGEAIQIAFQILLEYFEAK